MRRLNLPEYSLGCLSHNIFLDIENDNGLNLIEEWESRKDLDDHLQSEKFTLLMGTRYLLTDHWKSA